MPGKPKIIVFTDLDGTLLDFITYSFQVALPVIKELKKKKIPIILCTNKTRAENEYYQKKLKITDPFIVESGGAIFIPKNYFSFSFPYQKTKVNYKVIELGAPYSKVRKKIKKVREKLKYNIAGFADLSPKGIAKITGLNLAQAKLAQQRDYNEPFIIEVGTKEKIMKEFKKGGLQIQFGGRFYNASSSKSNKGKAIKILSSLFKKKFGKIKTIGLGDSQNDLSMLKAVDFAVLVQSPSGKWTPGIKLKKIIKIKEVGPRGWAKAIKKYAL
jgi:mannosyl-3-phosphoglycerate phosphatase